MARVSVRYGAYFAVLLIVLTLAYSFSFGPKNARDSTPRDTIVEPDQSLADVAHALEREGLAKHDWALSLAVWLTDAEVQLRPGAYRIAPSMDAWTILRALAQAPYLSWIEVPQGLRKEEIAELFKEAFGWDERGVEEFLAERSISPDLPEGAYYSGTYLIPSDLEPGRVAGRLRSKFEDIYAPYASEAAEQGRSWAEVVTFASIIEREASKNDKPLIAGILTNRLKRNMPLQVDATLQYITGNAEEGWWHAPSSEDKYVESPFNTYIYAGLPPEPIASPALSSIEAALHPEPTSCLYYLHEHGRIHCSATYAGHKANIDRYLR